MYIAAYSNNGTQNSGVKATREAAEIWAKNQFDGNGKFTNILIFEAVASWSIAPREIHKVELRPTEENTQPDVKCEACDPKPLLSNGRDHDPDAYIHDTY